MDRQLIEKYAAFAVKTGVNVQKGQTLIIGCPVEGAEFARMCAEAAYDAGAAEVVLQYEDEQFSRLRMQRGDIEVLEDVKPWLLARNLEYATAPGSVSVLRVSARNPEMYKGLDTEKINRATRALSKRMRPWQEMTMASRVQWCVVAIPGLAWAEKVFPGLSAAAAQEKLWEAILKTCRADKGDAEGEWQRHVAAMKRHQQALNGLALASLHLKSANGTDLVVGLPEGHLWGAAAEDSTEGVTFLPNIPTEEVFTAPHRLRTEGVVKSSMPYVYNGNLIEGITARFENGVAVEYSAEKGGDLLEQMLSADEGAKHLGEVALVPASSPIRQTGLLFYNTLFDENAACHIAFGAAYPGTMQGGEDMTREELDSRGMNDSLIHEDIMVGTADMCVTGTTADGRTVEIFRDGEWAL